MRAPSATPQILHSLLVTRSIRKYCRGLHWVDGPKEEGEATNCTVEGLGLGVLAGDGSLAVEGELPDNDEVCNAGNGIPAPLLSIAGAKGSEETSKDHDEIGNYSNQDVGTGETSKESQVHEEEWGGERPVDVSGPVDLTVDDIMGVWESVAVALGLDDLVVGDAIT